MKNPRMRDLNRITCFDNASRCVTGAVLFQEVTSGNAVAVLRQAICRFGTPATILSDNSSCFVGRGGRKKPTGNWTSTLFENELLDLGIGLINSQPYHPSDMWQLGSAWIGCRPGRCAHVRYASQSQAPQHGGGSFNLSDSVLAVIDYRKSTPCVRLL